MRTTMTNTTKITLSLSENDVLDLLALISTQIDDEHFAWGALRDEIKRQALAQKSDMLDC